MQLERGNKEFWSPGQVLESYLGFDRGLLLTAGYLWEVHGVRNPLPGIVPSVDYWPFLTRLSRQRHRLPSFRLNCFVQAKRCFVGRRLPKKLAALGDPRPFFRFDVNLDQQAVLDQSAAALEGRALFVYAAPVFAESRLLFHLQRVGQLVENSTFPEVRTLTDHAAWYYNRPGASGVVNQGYEFVEGRPLGDQVASLIESPAELRDATPSDNLEFLASTLQRVVLEPATGETSARIAYLADDWLAIDRFADQYDLPRAGRAFLQVYAFVLRLNLEWFAISERSAA